MTRSRSMRRLAVAATLGATFCATTQIAPATAAAPHTAAPVFPTGPGHVLTIDVYTGELLSITSPTPLSAAVVRQFDALPGAKTYTVDVYGRVVSIIRN